MRSQSASKRVCSAHLRRTFAAESSACALSLGLAHQAIPKERGSFLPANFAQLGRRSRAKPTCWSLGKEGCQSLRVPCGSDAPFSLLPLFASVQLVLAISPPRWWWVGAGWAEGRLEANGKADLIEGKRGGGGVDSSTGGRWSSCLPAGTFLVARSMDTVIPIIGSAEHSWKA